MSYNTQIIKLEDSGERVTIIVDSGGMPVDLPSRYLLQKRDNRSAKTLSNLATNICQLYRWSEDNGHDIEARIKSGEVLGITEIDSLIRYLRLNRRQASLIENSKNNVVPMGAYVSGAMLTQKIDAVKGYLEWLGRVALEGRLITDPYCQVIAPAIKDLNDQLDIRKTPSKSAPRYGLTMGEQRFLLEVTAPGHEKNPFQKRVQVRNHLMIKTLLMCGVRLGELLALQIPNCHLTGDNPYLYFTHNLTKDLDPRTMPPDVKTLSRRIYITKELAAEFDSYIMNERKFRGRRKIGKLAPYVFLNTQKEPQPLSEPGFYQVCVTLREKFPEELKALHPHRLRHTFNDNLVEMFSGDMKDEEFKKIQRWMNGWSDTSEEGKTYTRRSTEMKGMWALVKMQNTLMGGTCADAEWLDEDIDF